MMNSNKIISKISDIYISQNTTTKKLHYFFKMSSHCKFLSCIIFNLIVAQSIIAQQELKRQIFDDALAVWQSFRDPDNGVWCDTLRFNQKPMVQCGPNNNFYSSAGTGENFVQY